MIHSFTVRVTSIRSQNRTALGGAIFSGVPVDDGGSVTDSGAHIVVKASGAVIGRVPVERGQLWLVSGPIEERPLIVNGFQMTERQIEATQASLIRPSGEHIVNYLAENPAFEGIGHVKARRLWNEFGERLYGVLDSYDVDALSSVLTVETAQALVRAWAVLGESQTLQWLQSNGFDPKLGRKVLAFYGDDARETVEADPYRLLSFCAGWKQVDRFAREQFGIEADDPRRLQAAVEEACYRVFARGHTAMLSSELMNRIAPLLGPPPADTRWRDQLAAAITSGLANGTFVKAHHGLQPLGAVVMERQIAHAIQTRLTRHSASMVMPDEVERIIEEVRLTDGVELNDEQRAAVHAAAKHDFLCITGGAGVGKTTVLKVVYKLYDAARVKVIQLALAGRAAKRMQEATGRSASTIASFLKSHEDSHLDGPTVLVIDEASMVDVISMSRICAVLPEHVRLVLVGDPNQLMPVGPGLVLHALSGIPGVPFVELKTIKRYGGQIAEVATSIRDGRWTTLGADETAPVSFLSREPKLIGETVVDLLAIEPDNSQILCAVRNGPAGTEHLNALCQERFTAGATEVQVWNDEFECPVRVGLRLGDSVLCTRNMWTIGLQNGSLGKIVEVEDVAKPASTAVEADQPPVLAWIEWDDGQRRPLTRDMLEDIQLGYAVTVHKAQGSQWQRVIVPVTGSRLLDRTLLYTAVTRAQRQVVLVGDVDAARTAVLAQPRAAERNIGLDITVKTLLGMPMTHSDNQNKVNEEMKRRQ